MKYRNRRNGRIIEIDSQLCGGDWEPVMVPDPADADENESAEQVIPKEKETKPKKTAAGRKAQASPSKSSKSDSYATIKPRAAAGAKSQKKTTK